MDPKQHDWLVLDRFKSSADIVQFACPLSAHMESK